MHNTTDHCILHCDSRQISVLKSANYAIRKTRNDYIITSKTHVCHYQMQHIIVMEAYPATLGGMKGVNLDYITINFILTIYLWSTVT